MRAQFFAWFCSQVQADEYRLQKLEEKNSQTVAQKYPAGKKPASSFVPRRPSARTRN